jgi:hypothetical protein
MTGTGDSHEPRIVTRTWRVSRTGQIENERPGRRGPGASLFMKCSSGYVGLKGWTPAEAFPATGRGCYGAPRIGAFCSKSYIVSRRKR